MSGGGSTKSTSTTQNYSPEEAAQRAKVMREAQRMYDSGQLNQAYGGAAPVASSQATLDAQQGLLAQATAGAADVDQLRAAQTYGLTGAMDVANNPYFQGTLEAALRPQGQALSAGLQQVGSAAQSQGAYGGARHGISEGLTFDAAAQSMSDTAAKMGSDAYSKGQDTFAKTLALAPQTMASYTLPSQWMSAVGAQQETLSQGQADYEAAKAAWDANADIVALDNLAGVVYGGGSSTATNTAKNSGPARNPLMGAAGGALAGFSVGGPVGGAIGAVLGALM